MGPSDIARTASLAALLLATGCATRLEATDWQARLESREGASAPGDAAPPAADRAWREGPLQTHSALRYGLTRERSGGAVERWTMELHGPTAALTRGRSARITVTTDDVRVAYQSLQWDATIAVAREGKELRREETRLALGFVGADLWRACVTSKALIDAGVEDVAGSQREDLRESFSRAAAACIFMGATLAGSTELRGIASRVVQWPGLFSLLRLRIDVGISPYFTRVRPIDTPFGPGYALPIELEVNGDQAFVGEFHLVEPGGALLLVAGIVAIEGLAPDRPDDRLRIELVGPVPHDALDPEAPPRRHGIVPGLQLTRELAR